MAGTVRVRFAPSPTGSLHVGNVRTALYNWLFARHEGGSFLLRIEDTDLERSTAESRESIFRDLSWLGLNWDEEPVSQSQRLEVYREAAAQLLKGGLAYEDRDAEKGTAIRFRMPEGRTVVEDRVYGPVNFDNATIEDFVIIKSDGFPTYNFACVVDDAELGITHVIRGEGHLSNTPKQVLIYQALGLGPPAFAHLPMILGPDGSPLSKRHGATSVAEYRSQGLLPEALLNFLALLGWSPGDNREYLTMEDMAAAFSLERVSKTSSRFDGEKLMWLSAQHMKQAPVRHIVTLARELVGDKARSLSEAEWNLLVELYRERANSVGDLVSRADFVFHDEVTYDPAAVAEVLAKEGVGARLEAAAERLAGLSSFGQETLERELRAMSEAEGVGFGKLAQPIRVAVTGGRVSPPIFGTLAVVGRERVVERLRRAAAEFCRPKGREA
jgi:glutamyl-tRNA synthetase